jgi:predicted phosphoadenosine phosphosulfate sulfurtransferase
MKHRIFNKDINVLQAARSRIELIFDEFEEVQVSISGGKDSTVLLHLVLQEAEKRNRKFEVFFLDQEAEYDATVDLIRKQMNHPLVIAKWYQVPIYLTNATSYDDYFLYAWGENEQWMRNKEEIAIQTLQVDYPKRFYEFFNFLEKREPQKAYLVGLRAEESITRYRAVTKYTGYKDLKWSTKTGDAYKFYPIYDWTWNSIWKFIYDYNIAYNKIYDLMFWSNYSVYKMRVSNLIHEKSYKCLIDLPKFEPETYNLLCDRIKGIDTASRYASEKLIFSNRNLPTYYSSWQQYRDFLLANIQNDSHRGTFAKRFDKQPRSEMIFKSQVGQLLVNDYENSKSFDSNKHKKHEKMREKWMNLL